MKTMNSVLHKIVRVATAKGRFFQGEVVEENDDEICVFDDKTRERVYIARRAIDELVVKEPAKSPPSPDRDDRDEVFYRGGR